MVNRSLLLPFLATLSCNDAEPTIPLSAASLQDWVDVQGDGLICREKVAHFLEGIDADYPYSPSSVEFVDTVCGQYPVNPRKIDRDQDGFVEAEDCNDWDYGVKPFVFDGAVYPDNVDNNCDGIVDRGVLGPAPSLLPEFVYEDWETCGGTVYPSFMTSPSWEAFAGLGLDLLDQLDLKPYRRDTYRSPIKPVGANYYSALPIFHDYRQEVIPPLNDSPRLQKALYDWLKPALEERFRILPGADQEVVLSMLSSGVTYLNDYDGQAEQEYYARLLREGIDTDYFLWYNPVEGSGYEREGYQGDQFRPWHAFLHRRAEDGFRPEDMRKWFQTLHDDLEPIHHDN